MLLGPSIQSRVMSAISSITPSTLINNNCLHCNIPTTINSSNAVVCHFCERVACEECSLNCSKCKQQFCGFCATRSYGPNDSNNTGKCLGC